MLAKISDPTRQREPGTCVLCDTPDSKVTFEGALSFDGERGVAPS